MKKIIAVYLDVWCFNICSKNSNDWLSCVQHMTNKHRTADCLISTTINCCSMKFFSNKHFVIICNSSYKYWTVCTSIQQYIFVFNGSHLYSTFDIFFQQSAIYWAWYGLQNLPQLYKDYLIKKKLRKIRGKEEYQMTRMALRVIIVLQICAWKKN